MADLSDGLSLEVRAPARWDSSAPAVQALLMAIDDVLHEGRDHLGRLFGAPILWKLPCRLFLCCQLCLSTRQLGCCLCQLGHKSLKVRICTQWTNFRHYASDSLMFGE